MKCCQCKRDLPNEAFLYRIKTKDYAPMCFTCKAKQNKSNKLKAAQCPMFTTTTRGRV